MADASSAPEAVTSRLRLRYSLVDGPELRCPWCGEWWTITPEHWDTKRNDYDRCLACDRERSRLYAALRQRDAEYRTAKAEKSRRYRRWLKEHCPEYLPAYDRERKARERQRAVEYRATQGVTLGETLGSSTTSSTASSVTSSTTSRPTSKPTSTRMPVDTEAER